MDCAPARGQHEYARQRETNTAAVRPRFDDVGHRHRALTVDGVSGAAGGHLFAGRFDTRCLFKPDPGWGIGAVR